MTRVPLALSLLVPAQGAAHELAVGAGTKVPVEVGAQVEWFATRWVWPTFQIGYLPGPYVRTISAAAGAAGASDDVQTLIEDSIDDSLALTLLMRGRPFEAHGFFLEVGFTAYVLGGGVDVRDALQASGYDVPNCPTRRLDCDVPASSTLYLLPAGVGWRFSPHRALYLDVDAAWLFLLGANTTTDFDGAQADEALDRFMDEEVYGPYFYAAYLGLTLSWRTLQW